MKNLCVLLVIAMEVVYVIRYAYQTYKREISPTLSTWIIFFLGGSLSLTTYAIAEDHDFRSGILNTMDVAGTAAILVAILIWGKRNVRFKPFERWYLGGIAVIVSYGLISGNAWRSNVFTQILMVIGYIPTVHNLLTEKRNTESFSVWSCILATSFIALCPAVVDGNALAALYVIRNIVLVSVLIAVMAYYELQGRRRR